ncbi:protein of unknown function [Tenacibaculum sp. 190524A02b]|uniref:hypothetical protein n=1 Tax=Tenacibaculum vairaonense TaxID=3137860 RepID=UPI0032B1EFCA
MKKNIAVLLTTFFSFSLYCQKTLPNAKLKNESKQILQSSKFLNDEKPILIICSMKLNHSAFSRYVVRYLVAMKEMIKAKESYQDLKSILIVSTQGRNNYIDKFLKHSLVTNDSLKDVFEFYFDNHLDFIKAGDYESTFPSAFLYDKKGKLIAYTKGVGEVMRYRPEPKSPYDSFRKGQTTEELYRKTKAIKYMSEKIDQVLEKK